MNFNKLYENKYEILGKKYYNEIISYQSKYHSLMSPVQMAFLMALIRDQKVNNVLEIGVFQGVNSITMLKAGLSSNENFHLYSIDLSTDKNFYGKAAIDTFNKKEMEHFHLFLGKSVFDIEEIIPNNIKFDLVFIDAAHSHPLSLIDLIYSVPYLHDNSIILLHDIVDYDEPAWGESYIFEAWTYNKYRIYDYENKCFSSMGCIQIHNNKNDLYENIKTIAKTPFMANPWIIQQYRHHDMTINKINNLSTFGLGIEEEDLDKIASFMNKFYDEKISKDIYDIFYHNIKEYQTNWLEKVHESRMLHIFINRIMNLENYINSSIYKTSEIEIIYRLVNSIAWWIPVKKWRDNFRNKILYRTEQNRTEQNDSTICVLNNNIEYRKFQPMQQNIIAA